MTSGTVFDLLEACREPGCPVCRLESCHVQRYLDNQFYENVNDPNFREQLRRSLGFCREHAWLAVNERLGDVLGFALIYRDVIDHTLERLEKEGAERPRRSNWRKPAAEESGGRLHQFLTALTAQKRCPVCMKRDEMISFVVAALVEAMGGRELEEALRASEGLCLPHLKLALKAAGDPAVEEKLVSLHKEKLQALRAELTELIRKNDYRFMKEEPGPEGDSWLRAIARFVGRR